MQTTFQRLMTEAARSTRAGDLMHATALIQSALSKAVPADSGAPLETAAGGFGGTYRETDSNAFIIEGETRVIETMSQDDDLHRADRSTTQADAPQVRAPNTEERWLDGSFTHGGRTLDYKLYLPPDLHGTVPHARPLLVMLHGCTQDACDFADGTQMNALAKALGVIVLYPQQTQRANAQRCWNWFKPQHQRRGQGEPAAIEALVRRVVAEHDADANRVFVAGLSAGGAMADILGQCYPDTFAAVGIHSGIPMGAATDVSSALGVMRSGPQPAAHVVPGQPSGSSRLPTIVFHGDADKTVNERNGRAIVDALCASQPELGSPPAKRVVNGRTPGGRAYTRTIYVDEVKGPCVEYWQLHGAGHAWSGGSARGSYTDPLGVDSSAEMMRFFMAAADSRR